MLTAKLSDSLIAEILEFLGVSYSQPDLHTLDALLAAYIRRVPWESASRIVRRYRLGNQSLEQAVAWPEYFWRQAIDTGSGGTCFESNYAMQALLYGFGYQSYLTINDMAETHACHTAIIVLLHGEQWLVDVGIPLHVPIRLETGAIAQRAGPWLNYSIIPQTDQRSEIRREPHPKPYIFTLQNQPVDDASYRAAMVNDYGPAGFFLDQVIITRVVGPDVWRFSSADQPRRLEQFVDGRRIDHELGNNAAHRLARHFGMQEELLDYALGLVES